MQECYVAEMTITISADIPDLDSALDLYNSVEWTAYTRDPETLRRALEGSAHVVCAWDGEVLVGLARVISDGATIAYLQDVLVRPERHHTGVGRRLFDAAFEPFTEVRQKVLITDGSPQQRAFYTAMGFTEASNVEPDPVCAYVKFD